MNYSSNPRKFKNKKENNQKRENRTVTKLKPKVGKNEADSVVRVKEQLRRKG